MKVYVAQQTKDGFTVKRMLNVGHGIPVRMLPTDCRSFPTFDEANKAAKFMADQDNFIFVNMR